MQAKGVDTRDQSHDVSLTNDEPESIDPSIIADREASLQVTSW